MNVQHHLRSAAAAAILGACLVLAGCGERTNREDFAGLIKGKTEEQVRKNAGKPDGVEDQSASRHVWTYTSRTFEVQRMNKTDSKTVVTFTPGENGKLVVSDIKFVE